jgi:two-component system phosphate regulon sensor histidine kinase PhoR
MPSPLDANVFLSVSAVHYREGQRLLILRDVKDIHNMEQFRRYFVANDSHELRTPMTVLLGYLESMQGACPDDLSPAIDRMQEQARQMQALLNDLLELSRLQSDKPGSDERTVDVPAMLMQLREQADELSQGVHELHFEVDRHLYLHGAPADLESAFRNLINNAIHYTPQGGRIDVTWSGDNEAARLSVRDTGIGIPRRDIPRLTERFYRVGSDRSRHSGGTGLGLSIVKHVLNAHQARLQIDSELGEGSTFTCVFPRERVRTEDDREP